MSVRFLLMCLLLCRLFPSVAIAQVVHIPRNSTSGNIGKAVWYFEDKQASLDLHAVQEKALTQGKADVLNFGNSASAFWIRVAYRSSGSRQDYLVVDISNIEQIDCYVPTDTGTAHLQSGSIKPETPGVRITDNFTFELPGSDTSTKTLWLRVKTNNILMLPLKMAGSVGFSARNALETIYIGLLLALFIYNVFLYFSIKDQAYIWYFSYVSMLVIYIGGYLMGYSYLLGQSARTFLNLYPHAFASLGIAAALQFCKVFLDVPNAFPRAKRPLNILIGFCGVMTVISAMGYKSLASSILQGMAMIAPFVLLVLGILAYRRGLKPAKYYIAAWTSIQFASVITAMAFQGVFVIQDWTFDILPIGSSLELLLLAFALGDRYRIIREENYRLVQTQNQFLESQVEERTAILRDTIGQLENSNMVKNRLFSIIAHDLRSPFISLINIFTLKDMDVLSLDDLKLMLTQNRQHIDTIYNTLNNLLYWAKSQMEGTQTRLLTFDLEALIQDLIVVYDPLTKKKEITVHFEHQDLPRVHADENQIQLVIRNLLDNAVKFTPPGGRIDIRLRDADTDVEICLSNTIADPERFDIEKLTQQDSYASTYGTGNEKGVGLGLRLCREFIRGNGGELEVGLDGNVVSLGFKLSFA